MRVSVIIPVYNAAATLARCLDSLAVQTFRDFEVICVDDGSSDGGVEKVGGERRWSGFGDIALKVIRQENAGTFLARKRGVEAALGDYICFVDPDDWVKPQFLEKLVRAAEKGDWDIVQCGVELEETRERTEKQRAVSERYFNPDAPTIRDGGLLTRAYVHKRIGWNLIFRLFKASVVKAAFAELPEVNMINETDAAAFFGIAARSRRFRRISDRLYVYRYGDGISTRLDYTLDDFKRTLGKFDFLRGYVQHVRSTEAETAFVHMAQRMCENSRKSACARLPAGDVRNQAFNLLHDAFSLNPQPLTPNPQLSTSNHRAVHHIGIHYFNLRIGGVQRVLLQEIATLRELGLKVTLFLENAPEAEDFPVPDDVAVRMIPNSIGNVSDAEARIPQVVAAMRESGIDCWYDHAVFAPAFVQDLCIAKWLLGLPVWVHYHTVFTAPLAFRIHPEYFELQAHWLRMADVVLTLSRVDAAYFQSQAVRAVVLPNQLPNVCRTALAAPIPRPRGRKVLWCGRQSWEKHPEDAAKIVDLVRQELPDVELSLVSDVSDPYPFFAEASVYLSTSEMEGFSMTSAEALAYGLPIVAYRLENLDLYRGNPVVFQVEQGDVQAAARQIVAVLTDPDFERLRESARMSLAQFLAFDHGAFWRQMTTGKWTDSVSQVDGEIVAEMMRFLALNRGRRQANGHTTRAQHDPVTLRRIRNYIRDNGLRYTMKKSLRVLKDRLAFLRTRKRKAD